MTRGPKKDANMTVEEENKNQPSEEEAWPGRIRRRNDEKQAQFCLFFLNGNIERDLLAEAIQ